MSADAIAPNAAAFSIRTRPKPANMFSTVYTLGWRAMLKIKHVPFQLFDVTFTPIMFTLMFTYLFGGALAGSPKAYIQFLLPGILPQTILFITVYTGVGLNTDIQKGIFDRFRSLPMWQSSPIFGALLGDVFRYSVASSIIIGLGLALGFRPEGGAFGVLAAFLVVLTFALALSFVWIIFSMLVKTPESVMTTSFIFLMPLTFLSNIFVDPATMPSVLQTIVGANPVTHLTSASRALMHGQDALLPLLKVGIETVVLLLVAGPIALWMYHRER